MYGRSKEDFSDDTRIIFIDNPTAQDEARERLIASMTAASLEHRYIFLPRCQIKSIYAKLLRLCGSYFQRVGQANDMGDRPSDINQNIVNLDVRSLRFNMRLAYTKQRTRLKRELLAVAVSALFRPARSDLICLHREIENDEGYDFDDRQNRGETYQSPFKRFFFSVVALFLSGATFAAVGAIALCRSVWRRKGENASWLAISVFYFGVIGGWVLFWVQFLDGYLGLSVALALRRRRLRVCRRLGVMPTLSGFNANQVLECFMERQRME